jgi:hypothetical protein
LRFQTRADSAIKPYVTEVFSICSTRAARKEMFRKKSFRARDMIGCCVQSIDKRALDIRFVKAETVFFVVL